MLYIGVARGLAGPVLAGPLFDAGTFFLANSRSNVRKKCSNLALYLGFRSFDEPYGRTN